MFCFLTLQVPPALPHLLGRVTHAPMLHAKGKSCINNSSDDFCIIGKEKDQYLLRLKGNINQKYQKKCFKISYRHFLHPLIQ